MILTKSVDIPVSRLSGLPVRPDADFSMPDAHSMRRLAKISPSRQGTLLIIVAGLSAMLAGLAVTYISSLRSRTSDNAQNFIDAQSRLLLYAACAFLTERNGAIKEPPHPADEVAFPFFTHDRTISAPPLKARSDSPKDTWFRIHRVDPTTFNVTVGIGLTRGVRTDLEDGYIPLDIRDAIGTPSPGDRADLARREHVEFYRVNWSVGTPGYVTTMTRLSAAPGAW